MVSAIQDDYAIVLASGLFDASWYIAQYPGAVSKVLDPLTHYLSIGSKLGYQPNRLFDPAWYLMQNGDVAQSGHDPLLHYIGAGASEGRRPGPRFDPNYYRHRLGNATLAGREPLAHFLASGRVDDHGLDEYVDWLSRYDRITDEDRDKIVALIAEMSRPPLISVVMPVYETPEKYLRRAIESVIAQLYPYWELCIVDDCSPSSNIRRVLDGYKKSDARIKVQYRLRNGHISAASNDAVKLAEGSFIALLDHDDEMAEHALFLVANVIKQYPDVDLIYSDEDRIDLRGQRFNPYFKSDWDPELILAQNFFCHLGVYRRSLVEKIGGFRSRFDGSQDYDLVLRAQRETKPERIRHIPHILYHWRSIPGSTASNSDDAKPYARNAAAEAISDHLANSGLAATVVSSPHPAFSRVQLTLPTRPPQVSFVLSGGTEIDAQRTISSIIATETYPTFEIIVAHPRYAQTVGFSVRSFLSNKKIRSVTMAGSTTRTYAANLGAAAAKGELLCFLDCGVEIAHSGFLEELVAHVVLPGVGIVGGTVCAPDGLVCEACHFLDDESIDVAAYRGLRNDDFGYFGKAVLVQDCSAVPRSGFLIKKQLFASLDSFDAEQLDAAYANVDLCLKAAKAGFRTVWTPHARTVDKRSGSVDAPDEAIERARECMKSRWGEVLKRDPFLGPNLTLDEGRIALASMPRIIYPWRETKIEKDVDVAPEISADRLGASASTGLAPRRSPSSHLSLGRLWKRKRPLVDQHSRRTIAASGLFEPEWYLKQNADVADAGADPLDHYLIHGSVEGRPPNAGFDPTFYRKQNPDVVAAGQEPLTHYIAHGAEEGRRPNRFFDPVAYGRLHPDLGGVRLFSHYLSETLPSGSLQQDRDLIEGSGLFNGQWYLAKHPDVAAAEADPLIHYLSIGWTEGRFPNPGFDPVWYLQEYCDVAISKSEPLTHYIKIGSSEGRRPNRFFDPALYRAQHPSIVTSRLDPLAHELLTNNSAWNLSAAPTKPISTLPVTNDRNIDARRLIEASGLFSKSWYLSRNPDVSAANIDALEHYIGNGSQEGRAPNPAFDPVWYRETYPEMENSGLEPLLHYILYGAANGLRPNRDFDPAKYKACYPEMDKLGIGALAHYLLTNSGNTSRAGAHRIDPLRFTDLEDLDLPDLFHLRAIKPRGPIAVVAHVFHADVWREMADAISNVPTPFDMFVSLIAGISDQLEDEILQEFPWAYVLVFPRNRGRDVAPFVALLQSGALFHYDLICKIHSKRSTYVDDGDAWRRQLIDGVLGSKSKVTRIISAFARDPDLGVVVADGNMYSGEDRWSGNEYFLDKLLQRIAISVDYRKRSFPGGNMFWVRPLILRSLLGTRVNIHDFELEPMPVNGALGHAVERLIGLICEDAGMKVREWSDVERDWDEPTNSPSAKIYLFAFLLPQFHPIAENNAWWGEGFTEWTNVTRAKPMYAEHRQPKLPADLGFYDLRTPETRLAQAELAKRYGIDGFCYYYYWFNGQRILERPLNDVLKCGKPHLPFMICWANEPWSRNWDGLDEETLLPQTYEPGWEKVLAKDIAPILKDPRYFRLDERPMFLVYRARHIKNCKLAMQALRVALRHEGVDNLHLCAGRVDFPNDQDLPADPAELGFDSYYEFPPHRVPARLMTPRPSDVEDNSGTIFDYGKTVETAIERLETPVVGRRHRGVMVSFDNTARRAKRATVFHGASPTNFRRWLRATIMHERAREGDRVIFVNAWNEWAEGAALEPDRDFGRGWLEAVASATAE